MKPLHLYYKPYYVWIIDTKTNVYIMELTQNHIVRNKRFSYISDKILENEIEYKYLVLGAYLTLKKYK